MSNKAKTIFDIIRYSYRVWVGFLIYCGSMALAVVVTAVAFRRGLNPVILLSTGILGAFISFSLYKKFPERFALWRYHTKTKRNLRGIFENLMLFFLPPLSTFFMSVGICVFVGNLFNKSFTIVWQQSLQYLPGIITELKLNFVILIFFSLIFYVPCVSFLFYILKKFKKTTRSELAAIALAVIYSLAIIVVILYTGIGDSLPIISEKIVLFFLGFIPLHWFFELFVHSVIAKPRVIKKTGVGSIPDNVHGR